MGFLDRIRGRGDDDARGPNTAAGDSPLAPDGAPRRVPDVGVEPVEEIGVRPLSVDEQARLDAVREAYPEHGIDPGDPRRWQRHTTGPSTGTRARTRRR